MDGKKKYIIYVCMATKSAGRAASFMHQQATTLKLVQDEEDPCSRVVCR